MDTLGLLFNPIVKAVSGLGLPPEMAMAFLSLIGAAAYRAVQKLVIQRLPLKWKWVDNRLTMGILAKIFSAIFGKTSVLYNAKIDGDEKAKQALADETKRHVSEKLDPDIRKAFNEAMK